MHPRLYLLFLVLFACSLILAAPAGAQETLYNVSGIHVDASGSSSTEALNKAITEGRSRAFQIVYRRLTRQADWTRQPQLDAQGLLRLSRGYTIANERRSTTRYTADVTYMFNPDAITRTLRAANIAYMQAQAKRILVIPMSPGVAHGPWAAALSSPAFHDALVPFTVSAPEDDAGLTALNFDAAGWNDLSAVAVKNHVGEVALVQAIYANGKMTVNIRRLGPGEAPTKSSVDVPLAGTVGTTYPVAAQAAVRLMEDMWKTRTAVDYTQRGKLTVDVRIAGLAQWGEIQAALSGISNITAMQVTAMDINFARIQIAYGGGLEQLREQLAAQGLALTGKSGQWSLAKAS
jgi:hypothetical protein